MTRQCDMGCSGPKAEGTKEVETVSMDNTLEFRCENKERTGVLAGEL